MALFRTVLISTLVLMAASSRGDDSSVQAKRLFTSGRQHFDLGEYRDALRDFKEGYRLKDDPVFLYNIAQCHRLLNENTDAIHAYKVYLQRAPNAPNRGEVERKIAALEEAVASQQKASTTPPTGVLAPDRQGATTQETPPPTENKPAGTDTTSHAASSDNTLTKSAPDRAQPTPVYKKWWLWTAVGVVVVAGVGVGLGVGLTRNSSSGTTFPSVQF